MSNPIVEVARFNGGEFYKKSDPRSIDKFGAKGLWYFYNEELYYARSDSIKIWKVQVDGNTKLLNEQNPLITIPKYKNDSYIKNNMGAHLKYVVSLNPEIKSFLKNVSILVFSINFF